MNAEALAEPGSDRGLARTIREAFLACGELS
jgi:hypothetical protein